MPTICPNCGIENKDDAHFCKSCGAAIAGAGSATSTAAGFGSTQQQQYNPQATPPPYNASQQQQYNPHAAPPPYNASQQQQYGVRTPGAAASVILSVLGVWFSIIPVVGWIIGIILEVLALLQGIKSKPYSDVGAVGFFLSIISLVGVVITAIVIAAVGSSLTSLTRYLM